MKINFSLLTVSLDHEKLSIQVTKKLLRMFDKQIDLEKNFNHRLNPNVDNMVDHYA